jgi:uncharacterized phage protein (TIGR01671 family)
MREIKFRVWSLIGKTNNMIMLNNGVISDLKDIQNQWYVMQFTGMKDKNGVDIYEGDIQKVTYGKHYWVYVVGTCVSQFGNALFSNTIKNNLSVHVLTDKFTFLEQAATGRDYVRSGKNCEIIGNIHENPELLELK